MKVIAIANEKGGVGKSTITANLAVCAAKDGKTVLIIDTDIQGSSVYFRAIRQTDDIQAMQITQATVHKDITKFENFDLVIVDVGAKDTATFRSAMTTATHGVLIIPLLPSQYDLWGTENTFEVLKEARAYVNIKAYALLNKVIQNTKISKEAKKDLEELAKENNIELLNTTLYTRVDYQNSISHGQGVIEYSPKNAAAKEIGNLYIEIRKLLEV